MNSICCGENLRNVQLNFSENFIIKLKKIIEKSNIKNLNLNFESNCIEDINQFISNLYCFEELEKLKIILSKNKLNEIEGFGIDKK